MKRWAFVLVVPFIALVLASTVVAKDKAQPSRDPASTEEGPECNDDSTMGMLDCNHKQLLVIRRNMAKTLREIRAGIKTMYGDDAKEIESRLWASQKTYRAYASAQCRLESAEMLGGSGERLIFSACYLGKMQERLDALVKMANYYTELK